MTTEPTEGWLATTDTCWRCTGEGLVSTGWACPSCLGTGRTARIHRDCEAVSVAECDRRVADAVKDEQDRCTAWVEAQSWKWIAATLTGIESGEPA